MFQIAGRRAELLPKGLLTLTCPVLLAVRRTASASGVNVFFGFCDAMHAAAGLLKCMPHAAQGVHDDEVIQCARMGAAHLAEQFAQLLCCGVQLHFEHLYTVMQVHIAAASSARAYTRNLVHGTAGLGIT